MTEEEAKTKWCPMSRVSTVSDMKGFTCLSNRDISLLVPPNSFDPATDITKCIASDCMMWRWDRNSCVDKTGYCGLGGKP